MDQTGEQKRKRASYTRRPRGPRVWERIKADVVGGMSYRRAGLKWDTEWRTIASRARREGWARNMLEAERDRTLLLEDAARALAAPTEEALLAQARRALSDALDRGEAKDVRELAVAVRALTPARRREAEPDGPEAEAEPAAPPWSEQAHAAQRAPELAGDGTAWRTWVFLGGRGAGKTRAGAEWLDAVAQGSPGARLALVAPTLHDVREVMADGESGLLRLPRPGRPVWEATRRRLRWPNGAVAQGFSAEDPESLRGP